MFDFSPVQIIIVLVIALLVFGPKRLPEMGRNLGRSMREFKNSVSGDASAAPEPVGSAPHAGAPAEGRTSSAQTHQIAEAEGAPAVPGSGTTVSPAPTPELEEAELLHFDANDRRVGAPR